MHKSYSLCLYKIVKDTVVVVVTGLWCNEVTKDFVARVNLFCSCVCSTISYRVIVVSVGFYYRILTYTSTVCSLVSGCLLHRSGFWINTSTYGMDMDFRPQVLSTGKLASINIICNCAPLVVGNIMQ